MTRRESQVYRLMLGGLRNKQIASRLGISPKTVEFYVTQVLKEFDVQRRIELVLLHGGLSVQDLNPEGARGTSGGSEQRNGTGGGPTKGDW